MVQGGMSLIKYLIFGFNLLFVIMGLVLIIVGGLSVHETSEFNVVIGKLTISAAVLVIITGVLIFFIAFFGCCGAIKENHCMTITFSVLLFIILVLEIAAAASAYVFRDSVEKTVKTSMKDSIDEYSKDKIYRTAWDDMQHKLKCCGIDGPNDWNATIPKSCCKEDVDYDKCNQDDKFEDGCFGKLEQKLKKNALTIGISVIVFLFFQLLGIVCACCLANAIKKQYEVV